MTIAELIEQLEQLNPAMVVKVKMPDCTRDDLTTWVECDDVEVVGCTEVRLG